MAAHSPSLENFVGEALRAGRGKTEISVVLSEAGWPAGQVAAALTAFSDRPFTVPVPVPRPALHAREAFEYLVLYVTLVFSAWNLTDLLFLLIDQALPEATRHIGVSSFDEDRLRWGSASVSIGFCLFFAMVRYISLQVARDPARRLSPVRRWLTYAAVFLGVLALAGDGMALAYCALGGQLTPRILMRVLALGVVAGLPVNWHLSVLRREEGT
jgi:hypothetical protein